LDFDRAFDPVFYDYALEIDEPITEEVMQEFECHCGAAHCRGTMLELKSKKNAHTGPVTPEPPKAGTGFKP
jgi:hypothetical protein